VQFPIIIGLRRSRFLAVGIALVLSAALLAVLQLPWTPVLKGLLAAVLLGLAWRAGSEVMCSRLQLRLDADGVLAIAGEGGEFLPAALQPAATVHPWLTVFRIRIDGRQRRVFVLPDSLNRQDFRRLRVWLKWRASYHAAAVDVD
jgi:toxin CptA